MRKFIITILLANILTFASERCQELYDMFMNVLVVQMTELCETQYPNTIGYKFYIYDGKSYINMMLVFNGNSQHMFVEGDENPFVCSDKTIYSTELPEEIVKTLLIPQNCSDEFKDKIGMTHGD